MFKLNFFNSPFNFFNKQSTVNDTSKGNHNNNNNNAIHNHDKSKVISMNHSEDGDFVEVDIKKLSYAEVAALSRTTGLMKGDGNNGKNGGASANETGDVVDEHDLEREVTDYQMSTVLSKNVLKNKGDALENYLDNAAADDLDSFQDDVYFNDKSNRRSKKSKFLKKGK